MSETAGDELVFFNGINGATGEYLTEPTPVAEVAAAAQAQTWDQAQLDELAHRANQGAVDFAVLPEYGDGSDLAKVGWGVIFPASADPAQVDAILAAMEPLIARRREQTSKRDRFRILRGGEGFRWKNGKPETKSEFLERFKVGPGPVDPTQLPFYLLIVGDPQSIPFQFQYEMDVQYAVGRIYFPKLEDYASYARSVVAAETGQASLARRAVFFGVANKGDKATELSAVNLVKPLHDYVNARSAEFELGWTSQLVEPNDADRATLVSLMGGSQTPALLFTASHGMAWPYNHPQQGRFQGALLCQDWKGPTVEKVRREHFLAAEDLPESSNLLGSVVFNFACFGAGTPYWDEFAIAENKERSALAARPFLSALPMRLLSNPGGGALAVIGHVERAWTHSFTWGKLQSQTQAYQSLLFHLMDGKPIGKAMDDMNVRYAQIASQLAYNLGELKYDKNFISIYQLAFEWAATNDARGYAVLGDPAARAAVGETGTAVDTRPAITLTSRITGALPVVFASEALAPLSAAEKQLVETENKNLLSAHGSFSISSEEDAGASADGVGIGGSGNDGVTRNDGGNITEGTASIAGDIGLPGSPAGMEFDLNDGLASPGVQLPEAGDRPPRQPMIPDQVIAPPAAVPAGGRSFVSVMDAMAIALQEYDNPQPVSFAMGGESFNVLEDARDKVKQVVTGLNSALANLARSMERMTSDAGTLTITTGVIDDLKDFKPENGEPRYITRVSLGGDVSVFVPREAQEMDEMLLALHKEMVNEALANRVAFIKALGETVTSLFGGAKG